MLDDTPGAAHPSALIVVVAFHGAEQLVSTLAPLRELDVLVVDNSSSPAVRDAAGAAGADYLDSEANVGFARAVNAGVARAAGRDVVLVNPDALVDANTVRALVERLHAGARTAAVAPRLVHPDGTPQRVWWPFPTPNGAWLQAVGLGRRIPEREGFLVGAVLALRGNALAELGGFDPRYFLYSEESDWQRRATRRGWRLSLAEDLVATHVGGATSTDEGRRQVHFHAGAERYIRTWHGRSGWASYRTAVVFGSAVRGIVLPGSRGRAARRRATLFLRGPLRSEHGLGHPVAPSVVHVVLTNNFAGTEQLVCTEAVGLTGRGWDVTVVGGDPARMRAALGNEVRHVAAHTLLAGLRALAQLGRPDLVHAHLTAAELSAVLARLFTRAPVVATRHIAARRGASTGGRLAAPLVRRGLAHQIAISEFVADAVGEQCTVVPNAVATVEHVTAARERTVLVLQRLEPEKATDVALRAWAASGLADDGWRLQLAGSGGGRTALEELARTLHIADSVDFLGWVAEPGELLRTCGVLLAPAPAEPFGLSVVEAMAHGVPVVAADGGAHPDVLGPEGMLFPPGVVGAAAELLRRVAVDPQGAARHGAALQARQRMVFSVPAHLDGVECVYRLVTQ